MKNRGLTADSSSESSDGGPGSTRSNYTPASGKNNNPRSSAIQNNNNITAGGPRSPRTPALKSGGSGAGRTPTTRRKDLSLSERSSPGGSPRSRVTNNNNNNNNNGKRPPKAPRIETVEESWSSSSNSPSRRSSVTSIDTPMNSKNSKERKPRPPRLRTSQLRSRSTTTPEPEFYNPPAPKPKTKFDELWDMKKVEQGMIRVPIRVLEDLIQKEDIGKTYDLEERPVASGLFATVRKCTHRETGITYAAKYSSRFRVGVDCSMEVLHEIAMLSLSNDSNKIVHLKDVFKNKHEIILVLEYAPGGDFQHVLDEDMVPFEQDVTGYMGQVLEALQFLHEQDIAHLDIKPQNIVLMGQFPNCEIKLCDLEVARVIRPDEDIREIIGTPDYVAPEILAMDTVTLAADIWSLGVLAYVLLTGFSPFGGDTDQETLRNITSANLDFPLELFEGVSDDAIQFIKDCLVRDPKKRPSVKECLQHQWLSQNSEPPSPSPLMLKIPTPDHHQLFPMKVHSPSHSITNIASPSYSGGSSRRSCQTCRDKMTERKRYLSKSREAIYEKVAANSNLKKSLSKSRERLCDMRLTLSKSRDTLTNGEPQHQQLQPISGGGGGGTKHFSRSQEKFYKCLSKSQEVLSHALGGNMKRMAVNGAVSDIPYLSCMSAGSSGGATTPQGDTLDFVFLPGGQAVLMTSPDIQFSSIAGSGRSSPTADGPMEQPASTAASTLTLVNEPLLEVSEEEEQEPIIIIQDTTQEPVLRKRFSHTESMGTMDEPNKKYSWREELAKFQSQKPLRVAELIGTFSDAPSTSDIKSKRRGSLQITIDPGYLLDQLKDQEQNKVDLKLQRRKSTSAIPLKISDIKTFEIEMKNNENVSKTLVQERKKTWEYFEIDHPKAISDKKFQQLKAKYARRRTEKENKEKSRNLPDIQESKTDHDVTEVRIDPMTGQMSINKNNNNKLLRVEIPVFQPDDDGIGSLPNTPTSELTSTKLNSKKLDDGIFTSSEEILSEQKTSRRHSVQADLFLNPVNRMCTGAFSRAMEKYSLATDNNDSTSSDLPRRQSSPMLRSTSST